jgi:peptide/nickel transport system permease protein
LVETVFNLDGIGRWVAMAAVNLDMPALIGFILFFGVFFVVTSFIVDVIYAYLNPTDR